MERGRGAENPIYLSLHPPDPPDPPHPYTHQKLTTSPPLFFIFNRSSLQSLASIISQNLSSVCTHLSTHAPLLASMATFPLASYPGATQEGLLCQLLRKKLEPEVEDWVARGRRAAEEAGLEDGETKREMLELWSWAGVAANELARGHEWGGEGEGEEEEEVGGVGEEEEGEGEGEGDEMDGVKKEEEQEEQEETGETKAKTPSSSSSSAAAPPPPALPLPLDDVLKFLMTGVEPRR